MNLKTTSHQHHSYSYSSNLIGIQKFGHKHTWTICKHISMALFVKSLLRINTNGWLQLQLVVSQMVLTISIVRYFVIQKEQLVFLLLKLYRIWTCAHAYKLPIEFDEAKPHFLQMAKVGSYAFYWLGAQVEYGLLGCAIIRKSLILICQRQ